MTDKERDKQSEQSMKIREQRLQANKERVQSGEVELHKDVVSEQKSMDVPVDREEVVVERHPTGEARATDQPVGQGEEIRVPVSKEEVHVQKTPVQTGEVSIGKRQVQEQHEVRGEVKKERVRAVREGQAAIHGTPTDVYHPDHAHDQDWLPVEDEQQ